jgi:enoyl-CoA hydratase/carnithine racemase
VPREELDPATDALVETLANKSKAIVALGKRAFLAAEDLPLPRALEYLDEQFAMNIRAEDAAEGVAAFLEKRAPKWKDR